MLISFHAWRNCSISSWTDSTRIPGNWRCGSGWTGSRTGESRFLRLRLHLGRSGDPLQPLRRELQTHVQMPIPPLWDRGLKIVIRAIEDELATPEGRNPNRYTWVRTQLLHPSDERRGTLNHPVARQAEVLWDWAQRTEKEGGAAQAIELLERMLLLAPQHTSALAWLASLLRQQGMIEELADVTERLLLASPGNTEALLMRGRGPGAPAAAPGGRGGLRQAAQGQSGAPPGPPGRRPGPQPGRRGSLPAPGRGPGAGPGDHPCRCCGRPSISAS